MTRSAILLTLTLLTSSTAPQPAFAQAADAAPAVSAAARNARMQWWRDAKFGMFIHWGLYAAPAGTHDNKRIDGLGEWIMNNAKIPVAEYGRYAATFNPEKFDAEVFADIAQAAGMKYIIITAKHHDGFAMYHSEVSGYNIVDATPFARDPVRELAAACARRGIPFGVYYSQSQDWHHPGGGVSGGTWDKAQEGDHDKYLADIAIPQVKELLDTIKPAVLWFDTPFPMSKERAGDFLRLIQTRPGLIYNNRLGNDIPGDTETPEQSIPATGFPNRDWETCMTINDTWGYTSHDTHYKSAGTLIAQMIDVASKGGNYLLNVGPTADGIIPQPQVDRLREVGAWLAMNGEAIYGTSASPFEKAPVWGRVTRKPGKLYLFIFDWPADGKLWVNIGNKVTGAHLLTRPDMALTTAADEGRVVIRLPDAAPDGAVSVVALEIEGPVQVSPYMPVAQDADGTLQLRAGRAEVEGTVARLENGIDGNIGFWTRAEDIVQWTANVRQPGEFEVVLEYACPAETAASEFAFTGGENPLSGKVRDTGGWNDYASFPIGTIRIARPGAVTFSLKPSAMPGYAVMNLRSITLRPAAP